MAGDAAAARQGHHRLLAELTAAPDARVLDLGCGDGATLVELTGRVGASGWLLGIDRNPRALATAATVLRSGASRSLLVRADLAGPLPIATASVDRVLCHNTLEALADPAGLLAEAHRVLRPGGQAGQTVRQRPRPAGTAARRAERPTRVTGTIRPDPGSSWSPRRAPSAPWAIPSGRRRPRTNELDAGVCRVGWYSRRVRASAERGRVQGPGRAWPWRRCSSRPAAASSRRWIDASTGAATTPPRPSRP